MSEDKKLNRKNSSSLIIRMLRTIRVATEYVINFFKLVPAWLWSVTFILAIWQVISISYPFDMLVAALIGTAVSTVFLSRVAVRESGFVAPFGKPGNKKLCNYIVLTLLEIVYCCIWRLPRVLSLFLFMDAWLLFDARERPRRLLVAIGFTIAIGAFWLK